MAISLLLFGFAGLGFSTVFQKRLDPWLTHTWSRLQAAARAQFTPRAEPAADLLILQNLQAKLRAGQSLDSAIEALLSADYLPPVQKPRLAAILRGQPQRDFLSQFLTAALESGLPLISSLKALQRTLLAEKKLRQKARAMTSQARAQAEVLSWIPWALSAGILVLDFDWFRQAAADATSWLLWAFAFLLTGTGRAWMKRLLRRVLAPAGEAARLEEEVLPKLVLRVLAQLSLGQDPETALDRAWESMEDPRDRISFTRHAKGDNSLAQFRFLYGDAIASGGPLREDLLRFLEELHAAGEARWEERVQRLPVVMMAPLFTCFFPGSLLVLAGLLLPLLSNF